jgi:hypothetical protein
MSSTFSAKAGSLAGRQRSRDLRHNTGRALYVSELCSAVGVSDGRCGYAARKPWEDALSNTYGCAGCTLRGRLLRESATVTEIATLYGFWQFGRFAGQYNPCSESCLLPCLRAPPSIGGPRRPRFPHFCRNCIAHPIVFAQRSSNEAQALRHRQDYR